MKKEFNYKGYVYTITVNESEIQIKGLEEETRFDLFTSLKYIKDEIYKNHKCQIENVIRSKVETKVKELILAFETHVNMVKPSGIMHEGLYNMGFK